MVYDKLTNIERYYGMSKWIDLALDFIKNMDLAALPLGRTEIFEDKVFANVMDAEAREEDLLDFEVHRKYMDIQIDLKGTETIQIGLGQTNELEPFQEEIDYGKVSCASSAACVMGPGRFILCMVNEPHKPGIAVVEERTLRKCVIKVAID